jgi:recombination protein RecA
MLTEKVKGASAEDILPGQDSRVMSIFLKKYKAEAVRNGVSWIMINQMRTHIRFMGVTTDEEAGGNALKFYSDIRLSMKKAYKGVLEREEDTATGKQKVPYGCICSIWTEKNRYERPKIPMNIAIIYGKGIDNAYAYCDFLMNEGTISKSGAWFTIKFNGENKKMQGMNNVIDWVKEHKVEIRDYVNQNGGFKLLMSSKPVTEDDSEFESDYARVESAFENGLSQFQETDTTDGLENLGVDTNNSEESNVESTEDDSTETPNITESEKKQEKGSKKSKKEE